MNRIFSIHIPKTAGTSFYSILTHHEKSVSPHLKRRDVKDHQGLDSWINFRVIHGHYHYSECAPYITDDDLIIVWVRDPVKRVISNYNHFKSGLQNPSRNPLIYKENQHRINESLLEYAMREENRNRISTFLEGIQYGKNVFVGQVDKFEQDILRLAGLLGWKGKINIPFLNVGGQYEPDVSSYFIDQLANLNKRDILLYNRLGKNNGE